jgi:hypothetical protein
VNQAGTDISKDRCFIRHLFIATERLAFQPAPEPSVLWLLAAGVSGLLAVVAETRIGLLLHPDPLKMSES